MIASQEKARLIWRCRRGMLELDLILTQFMNQYGDSMTSEQAHVMARLLDEPDPVIYAWLIGQEEPTEKEFATLVTFIRTGRLV